MNKEDKVSNLIFKTQQNNSSVDANWTGKFKLSSKPFTSENREELKLDYHKQRLNQSKWAFYFSIGASFFGFIVIIISIGYGILMKNMQWPGVVSGVVIEAVSALFCGISNSANKKISEFFEQLTKDSNYDKAIDLAERIKIDEIKDQLCVKLSLHMAGLDEDKICKRTIEICKESNIE